MISLSQATNVGPAHPARVYSGLRQVPRNHNLKYKLGTWLLQSTINTNNRILEQIKQSIAKMCPGNPDVHSVTSHRWISKDT